MSVPFAIDVRVDYVSATAASGLTWSRAVGNARRPYDGGPFDFEIDLLPYIIKAVPLLVRLSQGGFASRLC